MTAIQTRRFAICAAAAASVIAATACHAQSTSTITQNGKTTTKQSGAGESQLHQRRDDAATDRAELEGDSSVTKRTTRTYASGGSRATISQDGGPSQTTVTGDANGQTIVSTSGTSTSVVTQSSGPDGAQAAADARADMLKSMREKQPDGPFKKFLDSMK